VTEEAAAVPARARRARRVPTLSSGVIVVRESDGAWRFLLLRAYTHWDFPKGLVETGEDALAAAIREAREEAQLVDLEFRWGQDHVETGPYRANKIARYYLAATRASEIVLPVNPELGRAEHHEGRWVDTDTARELVSARLRPVLDWALAKLHTN
jgi:8-oxo-dGTP pyrophosphatase MutT (NUDIX family)